MSQSAKIPARKFVSGIVLVFSIAYFTITNFRYGALSHAYTYWATSTLTRVDDTASLNFPPASYAEISEGNIAILDTMEKSSSEPDTAAWIQSETFAVEVPTISPASNNMVSSLR